MVKTDYNDIIVEVAGQFNRPDYLNAFGGRLLPETINAFRELNEHPDTVFTVLTGAGRFFSAGWDIRNNSFPSGPFETDADAKIAHATHLFPCLELIRTIIDHGKIFVLALNGPATGGGAAWFPGLADTILAADSCHLHAPFSALALVPENGSIRTLSHSLGIHRANDMLLYGNKVTAQQLHAWGTVSEVYPTEGFLSHVEAFLERQLQQNDGKSMMVAKRLQTAPLRNERLLAAFDAMDALHERLVEGAPTARFIKKIQELQGMCVKDAFWTFADLMIEKKEKESKL
ncbi:peroxisomal D3,D2-enoyl-isomerase [Cordyceps militaris]|uniref:Peroxisomal D3,D2-enoyl-isomerase n=1 Tax=Cordyceps militaris TaxID=73501 RepID=A0A2H4SUC8_CORMI|nr:peroxisomal D3,D2-enoyl-isomerase [Cordyceps militaris]